MSHSEREIRKFSVFFHFPFLSSPNPETLRGRPAGRTPVI